MKKILIFITLIIVFLKIGIAHAEILDLVNPTLAGARKAAEIMKEEAIKLGQPYGLFGAHLGMVEQDFLKSFKEVKKIDGEEASYKEYRTIEDNKVAVIFRFIKLKNYNINVLLQIVIIPVINYKTIEDVDNAYVLFRNYLIKNVNELSKIEYVKDNNGDIIEYKSSTSFKYSTLVHTVRIDNGTVQHVAYLFRKNKA